MHRITRTRIAMAVVLVLCAALGAAAAALVAHAGGAATATRITVNEREYHIALSRRTFRPGRVTFVVHNRGKIAHSLDIRGPGVSKRMRGTIRPGGSRTLVVRLSKGTYTLFCPIDSHAKLGMKTTIHSASAGTTTGTTGGTTTTWG
jgi:plastocyanin